MKNIKLIVLEYCPYCKQALSYIEELKQEDSKYENIKIEIIDEQKEKEKTLNFEYYYVPTFYLDDIKYYEGIVTKEIIKNLFDEVTDGASRTV